MNKTFEVVRFEVMRNLKKPSFWIAAIMIPILFIFYVMIAGFAGYSAGESLSAGSDTTDSKLAIADDAKYLKNYTFKNADDKEQTLEKYDSKEQGIKDIQDQKIDVFYYIPADFAEKGHVEIYTKPENPTIMDDYSAPIRTLLSSQASSDIPPIDYMIISGQIAFDATTYDAKDNHEIDFSETISRVVAPIIALVLFYILIVMLGNRIITAVTEEKENRISELILTSINPTNLIVGKIISLMILGLIQLLVLAIPIIVMLNFDALDAILPFEFEISVNPLDLVKYIVFLIASYFLFTGLCVMMSATAPTAKDANNYSAIIMILVIMPIFFMGSFSGEPVAMTYFLTYFPASAPLAVMMRGAAGSLPEWEFWLSLAEIIVISCIVTTIATKLFRRFAIDFTSKVNFKKLLGAPRESWKK